MVGEQQEAEAHLRDDQRLREREQVRDEAARLAPAVIRDPGEHGGAERREEDEECDCAMGR